jgi:hypothetical protein
MYLVHNMNQIHKLFNVLEKRNLCLYMRQEGVSVYVYAISVTKDKIKLNCFCTCYPRAFMGIR